MDVQSLAEQISRKGKGRQREEGYKGGYKGQDKSKEGYKGKNRDKGGYKGGYKGKDKNKGEYKGKGNPQNPFVASAQANQAAAAAAAAAATPAQAGPPYEFRGWGPALQAAAPAAAAAATPAAAQAAAPAVQSADVREWECTEGSRQRSERQDPSYSTEESRMERLVSRKGKSGMGELGRRSGPPTPKAGGPTRTRHLKDTPTSQHKNKQEADR